jgi:hypothetical protein
VKRTTLADQIGQISGGTPGIRAFLYANFSRVHLSDRSGVSVKAIRSQSSARIARESGFPPEIWKNFDQALPNGEIDHEDKVDMKVGSFIILEFAWTNDFAIQSYRSQAGPWMLFQGWKPLD